MSTLVCVLIVGLIVLLGCWLVRDRKEFLLQVVKALARRSELPKPPPPPPPPPDERDERQDILY